MSLIACTTGTVAVYARAGFEPLIVPVEAWDSNGTPFVAGDRGLQEANLWSADRSYYLESGADAARLLAEAAA